MHQIFIYNNSNQKNRTYIETRYKKYYGKEPTSSGKITSHEPTLLKLARSQL